MIHDTQHSRAPRIYPIFPLSNRVITDQRGIGTRRSNKGSLASRRSVTDHFHCAASLRSSMIHRSLPSHPPFINPFIDASERFDPRLVHDTHSSTGTPRLTNHDDHRSSSIARTKDSSIRPPVSSLVQRRDPERSSRWRARVETESGPRIRSRQRANSGEKNILGTRQRGPRRQPVNQPDYAARGTRRITCRSRGNRQRIELSGRTIPFQISFTTTPFLYFHGVPPRSLL